MATVSGIKTDGATFSKSYDKQTAADAKEIYVRTPLFFFFALWTIDRFFNILILILIKHRYPKNVCFSYEFEYFTITTHTHAIIIKASDNCKTDTATPTRPKKAQLEIWLINSASDWEPTKTTRRVGSDVWCDGGGRLETDREIEIDRKK